MTLEPAEPSSRLPPTERSLLSMQPAVLPGAQIVRTATPGVIRRRRPWPTAVVRQFRRQLPR